MTAVAPNEWETTAARRIGRRVLGPLFPFLLHLRPAEWPIMAAHTAVGWLLASGWALPNQRVWLGFAAWVVCLNGGTLALNSAFDRDDGDIAYLRAPPSPPRGLAVVAVLLMALGLLLTWSYGSVWRGLYLACMALSVAYSVPPMRLKAVAGVDWLINMVGFGALTAWAGWALSGRPLDLPHGLVIWAFCPMFAALYPLTQLYQVDHDRSRGDHTLAVRLGVRTSLRLAVACVTVGFGMLTVAALQMEWARGGALRWSALAVALVAWLVVLLPWHRDGREWASWEHQHAMYHALVAWALTDAAVLIAWLG